MRKMALVLRLDASGSRKKSEYEDRVDVDEDEDVMELGDEDRDDSEGLGEMRFSRGKSTAMVPPKVGRLVSPHMII